MGSLAVPWKKKSKEIRDLKFAEEVLEADRAALDWWLDRAPELANRVPQCLPGMIP